MLLGKGNLDETTRRRFRARWARKTQVTEREWRCLCLRHQHHECGAAVAVTQREKVLISTARRRQSTEKQNCSIVCSKRNNNNNNNKSFCGARRRATDRSGRNPHHQKQRRQRQQQQWPQRVIVFPIYQSRQPNDIQQSSSDQHRASYGRVHVSNGSTGLA